MQPNLLLHYCVPWEGFQKHIKPSPLRDKGTRAHLGKSKSSVLVERKKGKYIHSAVHLLIYSFNTLLRGILLLPGSRRRKTNGGQGPQEAQSVRERRTQSRKGRVRVGTKRSAESRGSTEKAPLTRLEMGTMEVLPWS